MQKQLLCCQLTTAIPCCDCAVVVVCRFCEQRGVDVRKRAPTSEGGTSILHIAVWNGHLPLVEWLLKHVGEKYGPDALHAVVNEADTAYYRCTPLIAACRTKVGFLNDRLKIVKLLVTAGANASVQDAYGDTCLHWAARLRYVVY